MKSTTLILNLPIQQEQVFTQTFKLERNRIQVGANRLIYFLGVFLFPALLANAIYASVLALKGEGLFIASGTTALVLLNLAIYLNNRTTRGNRTLIIGYRNIKILKNSNVLHTIPFEHLNITTLTYGMNENKGFPAIRIKAAAFGCMTIGSRQFSKEWQTTEAQIDCTTYLISSEEEWKRFTEIIKQFK